MPYTLPKWIFGSSQNAQEMGVPSNLWIGKWVWRLNGLGHTYQLTQAPPAGGRNLGSRLQLQLLLQQDLISAVIYI